MDYLVKRLFNNIISERIIPVCCRYAVKFWKMSFVTYKNVMFAALFHINHNILTDTITAFLQIKQVLNTSAS